MGRVNVEETNKEKMERKGLQDIDMMEAVKTAESYYTVRCICSHALAVSIKCRP